MAEAKEAMTSSITFEDESFVLLGKDVVSLLGLECEVCCEMFEMRSRPPKQLPCHHTVCLPCLKKMAASQSQTRSISCPKCRSKITRKAIEILPNDFRAVNGLEAISQAKSTYKNVCFMHNCQKLDNVCGTCSYPVCPDCVRLHHAQEDGHNITDVSQALKENEQIFYRIEIKCLQSLAVMREREGFIENSKQCLDFQKTKEVNELVERFDNYREMLIERQEILIDMIHDKVNQRKSEIESESLRLRKSIQELQEFYYRFRGSRQEEDVREIFKMRRKFIGDQHEMLKVFPLEDLCTGVEFTAVSEEPFVTNLIQLGDVKTKFEIGMLTYPERYDDSYTDVDDDDNENFDDD